MNTKMPFIEAYFEDYKSNERIKNIIDKNKCKIIPFSQVKNNTKFDNYDYILIVGKNELKKITTNSLIYKKHKRKLFYIGNYANYINSYNCESVFNKIKSGIVIYISEKYKADVITTNIMQNVCIVNMYKEKNMHCMSVSLASGGPGLGAMWGKERALEMLKSAGFRDVRIEQLSHDMQNYYYIMLKPSSASSQIRR